MKWYDIKRMVTDHIPIAHDTLHVHVGILIFTLLAYRWRRRRAGLVKAWMTVFVLQLCNEMLDARDWYKWTGNINWWESAVDTINTMLWPTIALIILLQVLWRDSNIRDEDIP